MKTFEQLLEERIKENKCQHLDPFEVFTRMKLSAIEAYNLFEQCKQNNANDE